MLEALYFGVDPNIPGNGGPACAATLSSLRKVVETIVISGIGMFYVGFGWKTLRVPKHFASREAPGGMCLSRRVLLVILSVTMGIEFGFKLATGTTIFLLNPCHVVTVMQIYLLMSSSHSAIACVVFRVIIYLLPGATLAVAFPVTNTRKLPFEVGVYFLQHYALLVVPVYLMWIGGSYTPEPLWDMGWSVFSLGALLLYHFIPLQLLAVLTQVNLNSLLCPAVSDPFHGPNYRAWAFLHQSIFVIVHGKLFVLVVRALMALARMLGLMGDVAIDHALHGTRTQNGILPNAPSPPSTILHAHSQ